MENATGTGKAGNSSAAETASVEAKLYGKRFRISYNADTRINFWGSAMRLGDRIVGDPDVGHVSYHAPDLQAKPKDKQVAPRMRPVRLAELLFRDGVFLNDEDDIIRASHGQKANSIHDRFMELVLSTRSGDVEDPDTTYKARVGQRFITREGEDRSIGYVALLADSGFDVTGALVHLSGARRTFKWTIYDHAPAPWSYLMQISGYKSDRFLPRDDRPKTGWLAWREANGRARTVDAGKPVKPIRARTVSQLPITHAMVPA